MLRETLMHTLIDLCLQDNSDHITYCIWEYSAYMMHLQIILFQIYMLF